MQKVSKQFISNLAKTTNIVEFMEDQYDCEFIFSKSSNWANTRCPMPNHNDGNPSFGVNIEKNTFNCFGCGCSGDLIKLVQDVEGLNFIEAIQKLASYQGIDIETTNLDIKYLMNELNETLNKTLQSQIESSFPGGLSEIGFLITFSKKIKSYEQKSNNNTEFIIWTDLIYKELDEYVFKNDYKKIEVLWKNFTKQAKVKLKDLSNES